MHSILFVCFLRRRLNRMFSRLLLFLDRTPWGQAGASGPLLKANAFASIVPEAFALTRSLVKKGADML